MQLVLARRLSPVELVGGLVCGHQEDVEASQGPDKHHAGRCVQQQRNGDGAMYHDPPDGPVLDRILRSSTRPA
jgi:hypothetical protein